MQAPAQLLEQVQVVEMELSPPRVWEMVAHLPRRRTPRWHASLMPHTAVPKARRVGQDGTSMLGIFDKPKESVLPGKNLKPGTGTGRFQLYISLSCQKE